MYPAYPFLALNAAMSLHIILSALGSKEKGTLVGMIPARLKLMAVVGVLLLSIDASVSRIYGLYEAYSAPLKVYQPLWGDETGANAIGNEEDTVCFGKEWYRFPSSFLLPNDARLEFIQDGFDGQLPAHFSSAPPLGSRALHRHFNDQNRQEVSRYVDVHRCAVLVDFIASKSSSDGAAPWMAQTPWLALTPWFERPFLDASRSPSWSRALYIPFVSARRNAYGRYVIFRRRQ